MPRMCSQLLSLGSVLGTIRLARLEYLSGGGNNAEGRCTSTGIKSNTVSHGVVTSRCSLGDGGVSTPVIYSSSLIPDGALRSPGVMVGAAGSRVEQCSNARASGSDAWLAACAEIFRGLLCDLLCAQEFMFAHLQ